MAENHYQVAIITGASSGIGRAVALELAKTGCAVGLTARRLEPMQELVEEITAANGKAYAVSCDVSDRENVHRAFKEITDKLGPADLLVANAGLLMPTSGARLNAESVEEIFRINFLGVIYSIEAVIRQMVKARKGHIVGISSMSGYIQMPRHSAYSASKAALNSQLTGLRHDLKGKGVQVSTICPGYIKTPMTEDLPFHLPFLIDQDKAVRLIMKAIMEKRRVYNFPRRLYMFTQLMNLLPVRLQDRIIAKYVPK